MFRAMVVYERLSGREPNSASRGAFCEGNLRMFEVVCWRLFCLPADQPIIREAGSERK